MSKRDKVHSKREGRNSKNRYAVAIMNDEVTVGHLPIDRFLSMFLVYKTRGNHFGVKCDRQRYSSNLIHGSLEVP